MDRRYLKLQSDIIKSDAVWGGPNKEYRYVLYRVWNLGKPHLAVIGLNPSVADEEFDDRTVRRCISFARRNGYGSLVMLNAFAYRSTDPKALTSISDPVGPENDYYIFKECGYAYDIVLAWGTHAKERGAKIIELLKIRALQCFGVNKDGTPKHPLYLPNSVKLQIFK